MNADGSGLTQITTDGRSSAPAWSPDGSQIVFLRRVNSPRDPLAANRRLRDERRRHESDPLDEDTAFRTSPTWSPDGALILFDQTNYWNRYSSTDLWTMMPDGSNRVELLDTPGIYEFSPDWQAV